MNNDDRLLIYKWLKILEPKKAIFNFIDEFAENAGDSRAIYQPQYVKIKDLLVHQSFVEPVDNSNYRLTKLSLDILECGGFDEYFIKKDTESKLASQLSSSVLRTNRHMRVNMWVIAGLTGLSLWVAFMQYRRDINEELKMSLEQEKIEMQKSIEDLRLKLDSILILHHAALLKSDSTYNKK